MPRHRARLALFAALGLLSTLALAWTSALACRWSTVGRETYALADHRCWQVFEETTLGGRVAWWQSMTGLHRPSAEGRPMSDDQIEQDCIDRRRLARCTLNPVPALGRPVDDADSNVDLQMVEARGWPFLALSCTIRRDTTRWAQYEAELSAATAKAQRRAPGQAPPLVGVLPREAKAEAWQMATGLSTSDVQPLQSVQVSVAMPIRIGGGFESPVTTRATNELSDTIVVPFRPIWAGFIADSTLLASLWGVLLSTGPLRRQLRLRRGLCPACAYDLRHEHAAGCPECGWNRPA